MKKCAATGLTPEIWSKHAMKENFSIPEHEHFWTSPFGLIHLAITDEKLARLAFSPQMRSLETEKAKEPFLKHCIAWLQAYFAGGRPSPQEMPLHLEGTIFQKQCWFALRDVPYGETVAYGDLAASMGLADAKKYARAIGGAMARNPVWIVLPCHRVIHADGSLGGYGGGLELKKRLLAHEKAQ